MKFQRYRIDSVFDLDGNEIEQRIKGTERILVPLVEGMNPLMIGDHVHMAYAAGYGVRKTAPLVCYIETVSGVVIVTENSVYKLNLEG